MHEAEVRRAAKCASAAAAGGIPNKKRKTCTPSVLSFVGVKNTKEHNALLDADLLRFMVMNDIPFSTDDDTWFLQLMGNAAPGWMPAGTAATACFSRVAALPSMLSLNPVFIPCAGSTKLRTVLLMGGYARVSSSLKERLENDYNISLAMDGWTDVRACVFYLCLQRCLSKPHQGTFSMFRTSPASATLPPMWQVSSCSCHALFCAHNLAW
jgi:hypothetical protein